MTCPSVVRIAGPADHQEIWRLFMFGHRENGQFTLAPEKADWYLQRALNPDAIPAWDVGPRGAIGVIGDIGKLEGLALLFVSSMWYSHDRHFEEYVVYVDPECRRSFHARSLVKWMKDQTVRTGVPLLSGIISNERTQAKCDLYGRLMPKAGEFFLYRGEATTALSSVAAVA